MSESKPRDDAFDEYLLRVYFTDAAGMRRKNYFSATEEDCGFAAGKIKHALESIGCSDILFNQAVEVISEDVRKSKLKSEKLHQRLLAARVNNDE